MQKEMTRQQSGYLNPQKYQIIYKLQLVWLQKQPFLGILTYY